MKKHFFISLSLTCAMALFAASATPLYAQGMISAPSLESDLSEAGLDGLVELDAQEAKRLGIVIDVYEAAELMPKVEEIAARIGKNSYVSKTFIKRLLNRHHQEHYQDAERFMPAIFATEFMQSAFARFLGGETRNVKN